MSPFVLELIGWTASLLFILAFYLVSSGRLDGASKTFNFLNLSGALLYMFYAITKDAMPLLVLEIFWGGIAAIALYKVYFRQNKTRG